MTKDITKAALRQSPEFNQRTKAENFDVLQMEKDRMKGNFLEKKHNDEMFMARLEKTLKELEHKGEISRELHERILADKKPGKKLLIKILDPNGSPEKYLLAEKEALELIEDLGEFRHITVSGLIGRNTVKVIIGKERRDPKTGEVIKVEPETDDTLNKQADNKPVPKTIRAGVSPEDFHGSKAA